eukprot:2891083-Amphidinium_carterae.2
MDQADTAANRIIGGVMLEATLTPKRELGYCSLGSSAVGLLRGPCYTTIVRKRVFAALLTTSKYG